MAGGKPLARRSELSQEGFEFDSTTRVLRIRHRRSGTVRIEGEGGSWTPLFVTFDDPHLPAGTTLKGEYPTGVITWIGDSWSIHAPSGGFGTFNLVTSNRAASNRTAGFQLRGPRVFAGIDVYNAGPAEATLRVDCPEAGEITVSVGPGALKRLRTGWHSACSSVTFDISPEAELQFDNLAYLP
jgi:hypothetical protein